MLGAVDPDVSLGAGAPFCSSIVPVSASLLPTCGVSAAGFATRRYVDDEAFAFGAADVLGAAVGGGAVVVGVLVVGSGVASAGDTTASVSTYFVSPAGAALGAVCPAVPAVPAVAVAPAVPVVAAVAAPLVAAAVVSAALPGAGFKHPVTVTRPAFDGLLG